MLDLTLILKALVEFSGLLILGQGIVYMLSFGKHEANAVYKFFRMLNSPVFMAARRITPRQVGDKHVLVVALLLLFWIWVALLYIKITSIPAPV